MKITKVSSAVAAAAVAAAAILASAPSALGDASAVTTASLGSQAKLDNGNVIQGWTITDLKPSTDPIPYDVRGTLWEVTATDEAIQGSVTPIVSNFNLRGAGGENYRALFQVATPQGVNPATIQQGQKTSGKIYFDVTGAQPTSVVYNAGGRDLLAWDKPAAPAPTQSGGSQSRPATSAATPATAAPAAEATPAPAAAEATPVPAGTEATPAGAGTRATDLPAATAATPVGTETAPAPAGAEATPAPLAHGTPVAEGAPVVEGAPAPAAVPAGAGNAATAVPPAEAAPAPAEAVPPVPGDPALVPAGVAPTTTVVPAPPAPVTAPASSHGPAA